MNHPDEQKDLQALARALQLAQGFSLLFCVYNSQALRHQVLVDLVRLQPNLGRFVWLRERPPSLEDGPWMEEGSTALHLYGFEGWLQEQDPFLLSLNQARNDLILRCQRPLVFWVREATLKAFAADAPDFFSVRSGNFFFHRQQEGPGATRWLWGYAPAESAMTPQERQGRLDILAQLAAEPGNELDFVWQSLSGSRLLELSGRPLAALELLAQRTTHLSDPIQTCILDFHRLSIGVRNSRMDSFETLNWLHASYANRLTTLDPEQQSRPAWDNASAISFLYSRLVDAYLQLFWGNQELTLQHCDYLQTYAQTLLLLDGKFQVAHLRALSSLQSQDYPAARAALTLAQQELTLSLGVEHPHQALLQHTEGWLFYQQGYLRPAQQAWETAAAGWSRCFSGKSRELHSVWSHLAQVCHELDDPQQAQVYEGKAQACNPGWIDLTPPNPGATET